MNELCENVLDVLVENGIERTFATMFLRKGLKDLGLTEDSVDEKKRGIVLQKHMFDAIQMFVDEQKAHNIIHKATLRM